MSRQNGKIAFEVFSRHPDGYTDSIMFECDTPKYAYKEAQSAARYYARKYDALTSVNAFILGEYHETVSCLMDCGLFDEPIHWNYWLEIDNFK